MRPSKVAAFLEAPEDLRETLLHRLLVGVDDDLRLFRILVGIVDPREPLDLPRPGAAVEPLHVAALVPVLVLLGQNTVDFNLEFPGTGFLVAGLLGALAGLGRGRTRRVAHRVRRLALVAGLLSILGLGAVTLGTLGRWGVARDLATEGSALAQRLDRGRPPRPILRELQAAIRRHPVDFYLQYLAGTAALRIPGEQPLRFFNRALVLNPRSALTEYQVGRALMWLDLNEQALGHMLAALQRQLPLSGTFARDLFRLLQVLWQAHPQERRAVREAMCGSGLEVLGRLPLGDCLLTGAFVERRRAEPMSRMLRRSERVLTNSRSPPGSSAQPISTGSHAGSLRLVAM